MSRATDDLCCVLHLGKENSGHCPDGISCVTVLCLGLCEFKIRAGFLHDHVDQVANGFLVIVFFGGLFSCWYPLKYNFL